MLTNPTNKKKGLFIVFEGGEGSGKSTHAKFLYEALGYIGVPCILTFEPGDSDLGKQIREILLKEDKYPISPRAEALLFAADRAQHVDRLIKPALEAGAVVICDRYMASTMAYQVHAGGLPKYRVRDISTWSSDGVSPDVTYLLDIDPGIGLERSKKVETNRFEEKSLEYHDKVRQGFLTERDESWVTIDARLSSDEIRRKIYHHARDLCSSYGYLPAVVNDPEAVDYLCFDCDAGLDESVMTDSSSAVRRMTCPYGHGVLLVTPTSRTWETNKSEVFPRCPQCQRKMKKDASEKNLLFCDNDHRYIAFQDLNHG